MPQRTTEREDVEDRDDVEDEEDREDEGTASSETQRKPSKRDENYPDRFIRYRHRGNARAAVQELLGDNLGYRQTFRLLRRQGKIIVENERMARELEDLDAENADLRKQIGDGVIVKGDDRKLVEAVKKLGLKPEEIEAIVKEHADLKREKSTRDRVGDASKAAKHYGFDPELLGEIVGDKNLVVIWKDVTVVRRGKTTTESVPHLRKADDATAEPIEARLYLKRNHPASLRALEAMEFDEEDEDEEDGLSDDTLDDEGEDEEEVDDEEEEDRPTRRVNARRDREEEDERGKRSGVRVPSHKGGRVPRGSRATRGVSETVKRTLDTTFVTPSERAKKA